MMRRVVVAVVGLTAATAFARPVVRPPTCERAIARFERVLRADLRAWIEESPGGLTRARAKEIDEQVATQARTARAQCKARWSGAMRSCVAGVREASELETCQREEYDRHPGREACERAIAHLVPLVREDFASFYATWSPGETEEFERVHFASWRQWCIEHDVFEVGRLACALDATTVAAFRTCEKAPVAAPPGSAAP